MAQCFNDVTSFWGAFQIMPQDVLLKILELEPNSLLAISSLNTKFRKLLLEKKLWDKVYKSLKISLGLTKGELLLDANDNWRLTYVSVRPYAFADHLPKPKKGSDKSMYGSPPMKREKSLSELMKVFRESDTEPERGILDLSSNSPLVGVARYDFFVFSNSGTVVDGTLLADPQYAKVKHLNCDYIISSSNSVLENLETISFVSHLGTKYITEYKEAKGGGMFGERKDRTSFPPNRKISHLHKMCPNIKKLYIRYPWVLWSDGTSQRDPEPVSYSCRNVYSADKSIFQELDKFKLLDQVIVEQIGLETSSLDNPDSLNFKLSSSDFSPKIIKLSFNRHCP